MQSDSDFSSGIRIKPRILIADDSRIVRATLIKHIQGMFEFREAFDGEHAWETLLIDPGIRVVITDLTMPKLDGYGLLRRIRSSKITRIREVPVIVISGSDEQEERERAKAAGATELITKGIATAQLLSRLDALSELASTQEEFERGLEALVRRVPPVFEEPVTSAQAFATAAEAMLAYGLRHRKNFVLLNIRVETREGDGGAGRPPEPVLAAIGQLLRRTVRQSDCVARTGETEFMLASNGIEIDSAYGFGQRICGAIAHADLPRERSAPLLVGCGLAHLGGGEKAAANLDALCEAARRRARIAAQRGVSGVAGAREDLLPASQG